MYRLSRAMDLRQRESAIPDRSCIGWQRSFPKILDVSPLARTEVTTSEKHDLKLTGRRENASGLHRTIDPSATYQ